MSAEKRVLLLLIAEDWYFWSHRLPLARAARQAGYQVVVVTRVRKLGRAIEAEGFDLVPLRLRRSGANPLLELRALAEIVGIYRRVRPNIVHHVALKPVIYGTLAARLAGVSRVVNSLAGLGFAYASTSWKARLLRSLLEPVFRCTLNLRNSRLILQNPDDIELFVSSGLVPSSRVRLIRGSGVDTALFRPTPEPKGPPAVMLAARMLWDKGVGEFVAAARELRARGVVARFILVGETDPENPSAIEPAQLHRWQEEGIVEWRGRRDDMPAVYAGCHLVCLPSYREGLPKVLLEAAACGRPIVASDVPGCREIVRHGVNGLLVPVRDSQALADALSRLVGDAEARRAMGERGRGIVVSEFGAERVATQILEVYREPPS